MHQDIEKLLKAAKEKGFITEKQRDIILFKAKQLDGDVSDVEFFLDDIPLKKSENTKVKAKRCPHCGAVVSDLEQTCPECGNSLFVEADASLRVRQIIKETSEKIDAIAKSGESIKEELKKRGKTSDFLIDVEVAKEINNRKVSIINAFNVPFTSTALIQGYLYAYGNSEVDSRSKFNMSFNEQQIYDAWLSKAKELYRLVQSIPNPDNQTQVWLDNNKSILDAKHKGKGAIVAMLLGIFILTLGIFYLASQS